MKMPLIKNKQAGVSLIGAIFIMVVLSAVGVFVLTLNSLQHTSTALTLQSSRALYAAESGMEWTAWSVRMNDICPTTGTNFDVDNFTVTVSCSETAVTEGVNSYKVFDTEVTATTTNSNFQDSDYSSRTLHSRIIGAF